MKNKKIIFFGALILFMLTSCSQNLFKKIRIKASPELRLNLGTRDILSKDFMSAEIINEEIKKMGGGLENLKVYEYSPKESPENIHYLIHYPVFDMDLNMSENFDAIKKLNEELSLGLQETTFTVPKIQNTQSSTLPLDINDTILKSFNKKSDIPLPSSLPAYEMGRDTDVEIPDPFEINFEDSFSSLTFDTQASLKFSISAEGASSNFKILITKIELKTTEGGQLSSFTGAAEIADLDLSGKTLPSKFKMYLSVRMQGGTPGHPFIPKLKQQITGRIKKVVGIKLDPIEHIINTEKLNLGVSNFDSAKISEGKIKYSISLPAGWTGFTISPHINISQGSGGLDLDIAASGTEQTKSLIGNTINNKDIDISGKIIISANGATYEYTDNMNAEVKFDVNVNKFEWVKLKMAEGFKLEYDYNQDITEIKKWVKQIDFNGLSSKIKLENILPSGNDIEIKLSSNVFGINSGFKNFPSNSTTENEMFNRGPFSLDLSTITNFDFKAEVKLPNYEPSTKLLTLNNISAGSTYKFGGSLNLNADWEKAIIKPGNAGTLQGTYPNEGGSIKFALLEDFPLLKNLHFSKPFKGYFYLNSSIIRGLNTSVDAEMAISLLHGKNNTDNEMLLAKSNNLNFVDKLPNFAESIPQNYQIPPASINMDDSLKVNDLIEKETNQLKFKYEFKLSEITIEKANIEGQENTKLRADILFDIPMSIKAVNDLDYKISIPDILFNQGAQINTWDANVQEILDMAQNMKLVIDYDNQIGMEVKAELLNPDWIEGGVPKFKKDINLGKGKGKININLTAEEFKHIRKNLPFKVDIKLSLPKGEYDLKKNGKLHFEAYTLLKMEVNKEFDR